MFRALSLLVACTPAPDPSDRGGSSTETESPPVDTADTGMVADCSGLLPMPAAADRLEAFVSGEFAVVHEDFTFDESGRLVGVDLHSGVLQAADSNGLVEPLVPGFERFVKGITALDDGRMALADPLVGAIRVVDPVTGAQQILAGGLVNPNGVALGPDGHLYVSTLDEIVQIDLVDGATTPIVEVTGLDLDGIAFSPDERTLYTDQPRGALFRATREADGTWSDAELFATLPVSTLRTGLVFDVADGMITDVCGNLYVVGMRGALHRYTPDGVEDGATALPGQPYELFTAARFGEGTGGWDEHTIYVTGLLGSVYAVPVGVAGVPR